MTFLEVMRERLIAANITGMTAKTIFTESMPSAVSVGIVLMGKMTGDVIDYELPGYRKTSLQLIVRCQNRQQGMEIMNSAVSAMTIQQETNLVTHKVNYVRPRHDPVMFPLSDGNKIEISVNFDVAYVMV